MLVVYQMNDPAGWSAPRPARVGPSEPAIGCDTRIFGEGAGPGAPVAGLPGVQVPAFGDFGPPGTHHEEARMPIRITSLIGSGPLWITLTSGAQLRLEPGQTSQERPDVDVQDNASVASLVRRGLIEVVSVSSGRRARAAGKKEAASPKSADADRYQGRAIARGGA